MKQLIQIQSELKAPKNQFNEFGNFKYRNLEDILESLKPILKKYDCTLIITDQLKGYGDNIYIEATAKLISEDKEVIVTACAGVQDRKGMDIAQSYGSSSSYARKYALNGLFLIDDTKDTDSVDNSVKNIATIQDSEEIGNLLSAIKKAKNISDLKMLWETITSEEQKVLKAVFEKRKREING